MHLGKRVKEDAKGADKTNLWFFVDDDILVRLYILPKDTNLMGMTMKEFLSVLENKTSDI